MYVGLVRRVLWLFAFWKVLVSAMKCCANITQSVAGVSAPYLACIPVCSYYTSMWYKYDFNEVFRKDVQAICENDRQYLNVLSGANQDNDASCFNNDPMLHDSCMVFNLTHERAETSLMVSAKAEESYAAWVNFARAEMLEGNLKKAGIFLNMAAVHLRYFKIDPSDEFYWDTLKKWVELQSRGYSMTFNALEGMMDIEEQLNAAPGQSSSVKLLSGFMELSRFYGEHLKMNETYILPAVESLLRAGLSAIFDKLIEDLFLLERQYDVFLILQAVTDIIDSSPPLTEYHNIFAEDAPLMKRIAEQPLTNVGTMWGAISAVIKFYAQADFSSLPELAQKSPERCLTYLDDKHDPIAQFEWIKTWALHYQSNPTTSWLMNAQDICQFFTNKTDLLSQIITQDPSQFPKNTNAIDEVVAMVTKLSLKEEEEERYRKSFVDKIVEKRMISLGTRE